MLQILNPTQTRALISFAPNRPLHDAVVQLPQLTSYDLLLQILACGVCAADLKIYRGELAPPQWPIVLGQQIVGIVLAVGHDVDRAFLGSCVGIPWRGSGCGSCRFCAKHLAQLCTNPLSNEPHHFGGFADYTVVDCRCAIPINPNANPVEIAPLLSAANLTRVTNESFPSLISEQINRETITTLPLGRAQEALELLERDDFKEAIVLLPGGE